MKVSVITATHRTWDMLPKQAECLGKQTMRDFEWIVVDDHFGKRDFALHGTFPIHHTLPRTPKEEFAAASAWNTGFLYAKGELVYFMNDYVFPSPGVLERHWKLYQEYGPKVIISGPLTAEENDSGWRSRQAERMIGEGVGEIVSDSLLGGWYWAGRNDSAPLALCLEVNGFDERCDGAHGGQDVEFARRMVNLGCRYLFDCEASAYECPKGGSKGGPGQKVPWLELYSEARSTGRIRAVNDWDIATERAKRLQGIAR